jgi:uncharacterized protein (DUF2384 family)
MEKTELSPDAIAALAERIFGDHDAAREWLPASDPALGNQAPSRLLSNDEHGRRVTAVLTRIEYGVCE